MTGKHIFQNSMVLVFVEEFMFTNVYTIRGVKINRTTMPAIFN